MIRRSDAYDLSRRNSFRLRVSCRTYVSLDGPEDLPLLDFETLPRPLLVLGAGANLLFTGDFPGTVLHLNRPAGAGITVLQVLSDGAVRVRVAAGVPFDDFCAWSSQEGLWGVENLSLIPGEVGGAAVQNIGAYGVEVAERIETVHAYDFLSRRPVDIPVSDCGYGYRTSRFKTDWKGRFIITAVTFCLSSEPCPCLDYGGVRAAVEARGGARSPGAVREAVSAIRQDKLPHPAVMGSAGSFFCNPVISPEQFRRIAELSRAEDGTPLPHYPAPGGVKIPAAWLIDRCGLKGAAEGGARVWERQPLVLVNADGKATPSDVLALEARIVAAVRDKFGVTLQPEVEHI